MQQQSPEPILTATTDPASSLSFGQAREIAQSHHFVFLCGLHRSGTTLLFRMLREHPEMTGFANNKVAAEWAPLEDEGQFLQGIYPPAMCYGGPGSFAFAPEAHLTESSELLTPGNKAQLAVDWFPYWDLSKPARASAPAPAGASHAGPPRGDGGQWPTAPARPRRAAPARCRGGARRSGPPGWPPRPRPGAAPWPARARAARSRFPGTGRQTAWRDCRRPAAESPPARPGPGS